MSPDANRKTILPLKWVSLLIIIDGYNELPEDFISQSYLHNLDEEGIKKKSEETVEYQVKIRALPNRNPKGSFKLLLYHQIGYVAWFLSTLI